MTRRLSLLAGWEGSSHLVPSEREEATTPRSRRREDETCLRQRQQRPVGAPPTPYFHFLAI